MTVTRVLPCGHSLSRVAFIAHPVDRWGITVPPAVRCGECGWLELTDAAFHALRSALGLEQEAS